MFYQGDDRVFDRNELDVRMLKYNYAMPLLREAANYKNDKTKKRSDFILRDTVPVYPDTLVWLSDFSYAANEPMVEGFEWAKPTADIWIRISTIRKLSCRRWGKK